MADKIYTLVVAPGIKRDGTKFDTNEFNSGTWTRFQRGVPKKVGGYRAMFADQIAIPRGMMSQSYNGVNFTGVGNAYGVKVFTTANDQGVGYGPFPVNIPLEWQSARIFQITANNTMTFQLNLGPQGQNLFATGGVAYVFNPTDKVDYPYDITSATYSQVTGLTTVVVVPRAGSPTIVASTPTTGQITPVILLSQNTAPYNGNQNVLWDFDVNYSPSGGALNVLCYGGSNLVNIDSSIPRQVFTTPIIQNPDTADWTLTGLRDISGDNPTGAPISVDGGVCVLYPFIFVFGSNGYIANNHVSTFESTGTGGTYSGINFTDWNGPTANQVNVAAGKVIKGLPVRGGTNSPSGLFWATNALIRMSFNGQAPRYWSNDILSTDCTIMSSKCVVEQDGVYYWMGTDRFYLYNGTVQTLANDKNINWVLDNLNIQYRQKVWGISIKRYNEVWWFYPRGDSTECNAVVCYNTKDKLWYDLGEAEGCRRSCGWPAEVFPFPIAAGWDYQTILGTAYTLNRIDTTGTNEVTIFVTGDITPNLPGTRMTFDANDTSDNYLVTAATYDVDNNESIITLNGLALPFPTPVVGDKVYQLNGGYNIWQHEYGLNRVFFDQITAVRANFETSDISYIGGNPTENLPVGTNRRTKMFRIEPDFVQSGEMTVEVVGRAFASSKVTYSDTYTFTPDNPKIDMDNEYRLINLIFQSDTINGNFEMGKVLITVETGDERP